MSASFLQHKQGAVVSPIELQETESGRTPSDPPEQPLDTSQTHNRASTANRNQVQKQSAPEVQQQGKTTAKWLLFLTLLYIALAIVSWTILAVLSRRPITANSYGWNYFSDSFFPWNPRGSWYDGNDNWYTAVRVILAIIGLLAVPMILWISSNAATVYVERRKLSMQQAVKVASHSRGPWLYLTIFMSLLGFVAFLLPQVLITTTQIYTPNFDHQIFNVLDFGTMYGFGGGEADDTFWAVGNATVASTRQAIATTTNNEVQGMLWVTEQPCSDLDIEGDYAVPCRLPGPALGNLSRLDDPFVAQLGYGFSTGTVQQFLPRVNSTATYENATTFPDCSGPNSYYVKRTNSTFLDAAENFVANFSIEACVPNTKITLRTTRERQDLTEELYIRVSIGQNAFNDRYLPAGGLNSYIGLVTMDTTTGYFELPNHNNGNKAGPLIPDTATFNSIVGENFSPQFSYDDGSNFNSGNTNLPLMNGPLLIIAQALFGNDSLLDNTMRYPQRYFANPNVLDPFACLDYLPLVQFTAEFYDEFDSTISNCLTPEYSRDWPLQMLSWVNMFAIADHERMSSAFSAAAFIANREWILQNIYLDNDFGTYLEADPGQLHWKPDISTASLIAISVLLGIFLISLFALAVYGRRRKNVYNRLHPFSLVFFGAANAGSIGHQERDATWTALSEVPAWTDDSEPLLSADADPHAHAHAA